MSTTTRSRPQTNGSGPPGATVAALPGPAVARNRARIAAGALLLAASVVVATLLYANVGDRQAVLAVAATVEVGGIIQAQDLSEVRVAADPGVRLVPAAERSTFIGRRAAITLLPGALLTPQSVTDGPVVPEGSAVVGAVLTRGQFPAGLRPGDRVLAVVIPAAASQDGDGEPTDPIEATVVTVGELGDGTGGSDVSLAVASADAPALAVAGARGELALVLEAR